MAYILPVLFLVCYMCILAQGTHEDYQRTFGKVRKEETRMESGQGNNLHRVRREEFGDFTSRNHTNTKYFEYEYNVTEKRPPQELEAELKKDLWKEIAGGLIHAVFDKKFPKLIVFDLDNTLWPFWVDTNVTRPFIKTNKGVIRDRNRKIVKQFEEVENILEFLKERHVKMAVASRTTEIRGANELMDLFGWNKFIEYREIFPSEKTAHFAILKNATGIAYKDMLFFDDEIRNSVDVSPLGVTCLVVEGGLSTQVLIAGLEKWAKNNNIDVTFKSNLSKPNIPTMEHPFFVGEK